MASLGFILASGRGWASGAGPAEQAQPGQKTVNVAPEPELTPRQKKYLAAINKDHHYDWKQPIKFFGKVVDETDNPVEGAKCRMTWTTLSLSGMGSRDVASRAEGLFLLSGARGKCLSVQVEKEGYWSSLSSQGSFELVDPFSTAFYVPEAANPFVFRLYRIPAHLPEVRHYRFQAPVRGETNVLSFDPFSAIIGTNGICVSLSQEAAGGKPALVIKYETGGLQPVGSRDEHLAPADGYLKERVLPLEWNDGPQLWKDLEWDYFVTGQSGQRYGRIHFQALFGRGSALRATVYCTVLLNLEGGRALHVEPGHTPLLLDDWYIQRQQVPWQ